MSFDCLATGPAAAVLFVLLLATAWPTGRAVAEQPLGRGPRGLRAASEPKRETRRRWRQLQMDNNNDPNKQHPVDDALDDAYTWTDDDFNDRSTWSDLDQFTYQNEGSHWPNNVYPPDQWLKVGCLDTDTCLGWPDTFDASEGWKLTANHCQWCPAEGNNTCGKHHGSPINLFRNVAIKGDPMQNDCIDVHWMQYIDSSCTFEHLQRLNAFTIERYGLKIKQPLEQLDDGTYINGCQVPGVGSRWGKIDFSRGFSQWWLLSHVDLHVPSEHTQNGHRYSAELQMYHFYSIDTEGTEYQTNQMAALSVFLQAYDDAPDYDVLNRLICQWRKVEERTRADCGLPSVEDTYPGCYPYSRGWNSSDTATADNATATAENSTVPADNGTATEAGDGAGAGRNSSTDGSYSSIFNLSALVNRRRQLQDEDQPAQRRRRAGALSMHDLVVEDYARGGSDSDGRPSARLRVDPSELDGLPLSEAEWRAFLEEARSSSEPNAADESGNPSHGRKMLDYDYVSWNNYFPMLGCKTEYYYRYSGSMTIPPCFGRLRLGADNRANTNNWRVMKDPIRVSQRQIDELNRLVRMRVAPSDDPLRACQPDTAAKVNPSNPAQVSTARPLQSFQETHWMVFCECENWESKWPEDQEWCLLDKPSRMHTHPYNFNSSGY